jgi:hypothetical protein
MLHEELRGGLIEQRPVLDAADPQLECPGHRLGRVRVRRHVAPRVACLLDGGRDLLFGELGGVDPVGRRGDASSKHELDVTRPAADLVAYGGPDGGRSVADEPDGRQDRAQGVRARLTGSAEVTVAAGLGESRPAVVDPWTAQIALLDGSDQSVVGASDISHGGEAASKHGPHEVGRPSRDVEG